MDPDREQLKLLEIFHYVRGALGCLFGLFGLGYAAIFLLIAVATANSSGRDHLPILVALIPISIGVFFFLVSEITGVLSLIAGWQYRVLKNYYFCFIVAVLECFTGLTGIALGVFAIVVLNRPSVKALFAEKSNAAPPPAPAA